MYNLSTRQNGYSTNLDEFIDIEIRLAVFIVAFLVMVFNGTAFVALCRTRHTPQNAKFLSSALLLFDNLASLSLTLRNFVREAKYNLLFQLMALGWIQLSYVEIAIMSIERLVVFQWPNFYLRKVTLGKTKKACFVIWTLYLGLFTFKYTWCYIAEYPSVTDPEICLENVILQFATGTHLTSTVVACSCLTRISFIIINQSSKTYGKRRSFKTHKSTVVVLICVLNSILNSICAFLLVFMVEQNYTRRLASDIQTILNGFLDTWVYVLWYKECRLELLKMFNRIFPSFDMKAERMRIEIFEINIYRSESQT